MELLILLVLLFAGIGICFYQRYTDRRELEAKLNGLTETIGTLAQDVGTHNVRVDADIEGVSKKFKEENARLWDNFQKNLSPVNDALNQHANRLNQLTNIVDGQSAQIKQITEGLNKALDQWNKIIEKFQGGVNASSKTKKLPVSSNNRRAKRPKSVSRS